MASHTSDLSTKVQPSEKPLATLSEILHLKVWGKDFTCVCYFKSKRSRRCGNRINRRCLRTAALLLEKTPDSGRGLRLVLTDIARQLICKTCDKNKVSQIVPVWKHRVLEFIFDHGVEGQMQGQVLVQYPQTPEGAYTNINVDMAGVIEHSLTTSTPASSRPTFPDLSTWFSTPGIAQGQGQALTTHTSAPISPSFEGPANPSQRATAPSTTPPSPKAQNSPRERTADSLQNSRPALEALHAFLAKPTSRRLPAQRQPIEGGLCSICCVPLDTYGGELDQLGSTKLTSLRRDDPLTVTWCKAQCGLNFHRACIWIWNDSCVRRKIETACPH